MQNITLKKLKKLFTSSYFVCLMSFLLVSLLILIFAKCGVFKSCGESITVYLVSLVLFIPVFTIALNNFKKAGFAEIIMLLAISAAVIYIRENMFSFVSNDYKVFLANWVGKYSGMSFKNFLVTPLANYNMPYLYILFIISKVPVNPINLIKGVSCVADIGAAYYAMRLSGFKKSSYNVALITFFAVLALPTVMLNSACWGQCDSIYAAFALGGLYYALKDRPNLSMIMFGLSFAFKSQAVIVLPVIVILMLMKKIKPLHLIYLPALFLLPMVPPIIAGRPVGKTLSIYFDQFGGQKHLTYGTSTFFSFIQNAPYDTFKKAGIAAAAAAILLILYAAYRIKDRLTSKLVLDFFFAFSLFVPYFLPSMHDRYFYLADICAVIYCVYHAKRWYYAALVPLCSFFDYARYLFSVNSPDARILAIIRGAVILLVIKDFLRETAIAQKPEPDFPETGFKKSGEVKNALR